VERISAPFRDGGTARLEEDHLAAFLSSTDIRGIAMFGLKEVLAAARTARDSGMDKNHHISTLGLILMAASLGQLLSS